MHNGNCYPNGSYFLDGNIKLVINSITCAMAGSDIDNGKWTGPNGSTIACPGSSSSGNLNCANESNSLKLFIPEYHQIVLSEDGLYKCCLKAGCSDSIFANIFSKCSHCTSAHCHLLLIYCRMGTG